MGDKDMSSLETATFDELTDELGKRCKSLVILAVMDGSKSSETINRYRAKGDATHCLGLAHECVLSCEHAVKKAWKDSVDPLGN